MSLILDTSIWIEYFKGKENYLINVSNLSKKEKSLLLKSSLLSYLNALSIKEK